CARGGANFDWYFDVW
nr:immunoglobulin heavy chain junction region [Mus musculus]